MSSFTIQPLRRITMKNPVAKLIAGYLKMIITPYDVAPEHPYSQKTMAEQKVIQDAAMFVADYTKRTNEARNATVSDTGPRTAL
jgi:hypothetical protein